MYAEIYAEFRCTLGEKILPFELTTSYLTIQIEDEAFVVYGRAFVFIRSLLFGGDPSLCCFSCASAVIQQ